MDVEVAKDISRVVRQVLGKRGASARIEVRDDRVWLVLRSGSVSVEVGPLAEQWAVLPHEIQQKKAREIAAALRERAHDVGAGGALGDLPAKPHLIAVGIGGVVTALFLVLVVIWWLDTAESPARDVGPDAGPAASSTEAGEVRVRRVCEAARNQLISGAKVGALDTGGWVVELWLDGPDPDKVRASVASAVSEQGGLQAPAEAGLIEIADGRAAVGPGMKILSGSEPVGATLTLSHGFSRAYMDPLLRAHMMAFADALADQAGAEHAALYARCEHLTHHDMGAWFRGSDPARAASSMMFVVGTFADSPALDRTQLAAAPRPLATLDEAASPLDIERLAVLVGTDGGSISSRKEPASVTVTFSAAVSTKALIATRVITGELKLDR